MQAHLCIGAGTYPAVFSGTFTLPIEWKSPDYTKKMLCFLTLLTFGLMVLKTV